MGLASKHSAVVSKFRVDLYVVVFDPRHWSTGAVLAPYSGASDWQHIDSVGVVQQYERFQGLTLPAHNRALTSYIVMMILRPQRPLASLLG